MVIKFIGKHSISILFILSVACSKVEKEPNAYSYKNSKLAIEDRVQNLLSQMTLEEKVAQTASAVGGSEMFFDSLGNFNTTMFNKKYPYGVGMIGLFHNETTLTSDEQVKRTNIILKYF